jgi:hypothetical protein
MLDLTVKKGRPVFQANEHDREQVMEMARMGTRHDDIAKLVGIAPKTLRKHFRSELDRGAAGANNKVMGVLFGMATSGKNTAATMFWVKSRAGWRDETPAPKAKAREAAKERLPSLMVVQSE